MTACIACAGYYRSAALVAGLLPLIWMGDGETPRQQPQSVVIITIDTVRADVLPVYGGANVETPAFDRLAHDSVVFEQATSVAPLTLPAHCSLFTGLVPPHHGVRENVDSPLGNQYTTLAEVTHAHGMRSAAFVGSAVVGARRGLAQGFDTYSDGQRPQSNARLRRPANVVTDEAIEWITHRSGAPFFAWVHLYDAHAPYSLPEPYRTMYEDMPYLGAIAFMDAQLARLLKALEATHLAERTMIVVVADHGESLGEHGEDGHGILLYQSTLRVPLIIRLPGVAPRRVADLVRLVDVMPTVLEALGFTPPQTDGVSLLALMQRQIPHLELEAYSESLYPRRFGWSDLRALRAGRFKYVSAPLPELYDLEQDPGEVRNIYDERRPLAAAMARRLSTVGESSSSDAVRLSAPDRESLQRLASLGYVAATSLTGVAGVTRPRPNPVDCIGVYNAIVRKATAAPTNPVVSDAIFSAPRVWERHVSSCASELFASTLLDEASSHERRPALPTNRMLHAASR